MDVSGPGLRVASYRLRTTFRHKRAGYLAVVLLIGLIGGLAMGATAAARRTQSAFPIYLASTNPSDLNLPTASWQPGMPDTAGADPTIPDTLAKLPHVKRVENEYSINAQPLGRNGLPVPPPPHAEALGLSILNNDSSTDGELFDQDRVTAVQGRLANPKRADEIVVTSIVAQALHLHVGQTLPIGFYTNPQTTLPGYGTLPSFNVKPHLAMDMKVVGVVAFNNQVVLDSLSFTGTAQIVYTPALAHRLVQCCISSTTTALKLDHGAADVRSVEREIESVAAGQSVFFGVAPNVAVAERAIKPESIALGVFGGIAALAALVIAGLAIGRQLRTGAEERRTLRALGADPAMVVEDGVLGLIPAVVVGSLLAVAVAVGLSPLSPIGVVRPVYPDSGVAFDWTVLGCGFAILVVLLSGMSWLAAYRQTPHRVALRGDGDPGRESRAAGFAVRSGLPVSSVEGIRFALPPAGAETGVPVRSAVAGTVVAMIVLIATLTFGASLNTLVSHPDLYGWNWDYELTGGGGIAPVPGQQAALLLGHDNRVAAWSAITFGGASIDGQVVPTLGQRPYAPVAPPVLSGHGLEGSDQIVLGGATLSALHLHVGDTVRASVGGSPPTRLKIVGTATMPTIGAQIGGLHTTMGTGALVTASLIPSAASNPNNVVPDGPSAVLVRMRTGTDPAVALRSLGKIASELTLPTNYGVSVLSVQRPAEIINYRSMGAIPAYLGMGLAAGAAGALGLTLVASVRRRRRDLALLKAIGFTRRQLTSTVAWQASVVIFIGTLVGAPIGIVVGRSLWDLFARQIDAVAQPTIPVLTVLLIAVGALALANVIAAIPGLIAARTSTALLLRAE
jgi:hypothetical protein